MPSLVRTAGSLNLISVPLIDMQVGLELDKERPGSRVNGVPDIWIIVTPSRIIHTDDGLFIIGISCAEVLITNVVLFVLNFS